MARAHRERVSVVPARNGSPFPFIFCLPPTLRFNFSSSLYSRSSTCYHRDHRHGARCQYGKGGRWSSRDSSRLRLYSSLSFWLFLFSNREILSHGVRWLYTCCKSMSFELETPLSRYHFAKMLASPPWLPYNYVGALARRILSAGEISPQLEGNISGKREPYVRNTVVRRGQSISRKQSEKHERCRTRVYGSDGDIA